MGFGHLTSALGYTRDFKLGDYWLTPDGRTLPIYPNGYSASSGVPIHYSPDPLSAGWVRMTGTPNTSAPSSSSYPSSPVPVHQSGGGTSITSPTGTSSQQQAAGGSGLPMPPPRSTTSSILSNPKVVIGAGLGIGALALMLLKK